MNAVLKILCYAIQYMCVCVSVLNDNAAAATIFCQFYLLNQLVVFDRGIRPMGGEGGGQDRKSHEELSSRDRVDFIDLYILFIFFFSFSFFL